MTFYDALTKPQSVKAFYENTQLVAITNELTEMLRQSRTIDWQKKESVRAGMRRMMKEVQVPARGQEDALQTIMRQCELWADQL